MPDYVTDDILALCQELNLLDAGQLRKIQGELLERPNTAQGLLRLLVGWKYLTPHQVNEINRGRGRTLLIDKYLILSPLSKGGMGEVFLAYHRDLARHVTLKLIKPEHLTNSEEAMHFVERFRREGAAIARLNHPKIVRVFDAGQAGESGNRYYIAMEYLEGKDLRDILKEKGPLSISHASAYIRQAAEGLQHLHERHIVHRDIKPANLLLTNDDEIKILDLGIALLAEASGDQQTESDLTRGVRGLGTPAYMAPEQQRNPHHVDIRADIYSLGRTFYSLLTAKVPPALEGEELVNTIRAEVPGISTTIIEILKQMLATKQVDRFQNPQQIVDALDETGTTATTRTFLPLIKTLPKQYLYSLTMGGIAIGLILGVFLLNGTLWSGKQSDTDQHQFLDDEHSLPLLQTGYPGKEGAPQDSSPTKRLPRTKNPITSNLQKAGYYGKTRLLYGHTDKAQGAEFVGNSKQVLSVSFAEAILWNLDKDEPLKRRNRFPTIGFGGIDRKALKQINPEDATTRMEAFRIQAEESRFLHDSVAVSPDGQFALFGGCSMAMLWDIKKWQKSEFFVYQHTGTVGSCVGFSPDGEVAFYASYDNLVRLYDVKKRKMIRSVSGRVACISFDGDWLLTGTVSRSGIYEKIPIQLYDTETYQRTKQFGQHRGGISGIAMSPDNKLALSSGMYDNNAIIWDVKTGAEVVRLKGHEKPIRSVAFSPNGLTVLTGSEDGMIRLWEVKTGKELAISKQHTQAITSVRYSASGLYALSSSEDQTIGIWELFVK